MNGTETSLPLEGLRVVEMSLAVMGPTAGMVLADMGAEVIRVERTPEGDDTRRLKGFGAGFFTCFNRNKKSLVLDLKREEGREVLERLLATADVLVENFAPGTVDRLGFGYDRVKEINPRIVYCSLKGFMPGPYEHRPALDEVCQMMGGLAYMTGPSGRPLRAGASVVDILGGSFGVIGILAALYERERTGRGQHVRATLFEAVALLVAQHMAVAAVTGEAPPPMPERGRAWSVYDLFETADRDLVFIGLTSDAHWRRFCAAFGFDDLAADPHLAANNDRIDRRDRLLPELRRRVALREKAEIMALAEGAGIPFAPIAKPQDLFEDPQLNASGGLVETRLPDGRTVRLPKIPLRMGERDFGLRRHPPAPGEGSEDLLRSLGIGPERAAELEAAGILVRRPEGGG
jgi:crotonobetainyl-CoA:carnitine CoA-transferase CaiB-like acyl-CoA transferase